MPRIVPLTTEERFQNAAWGMQDLLVLVAVPAGASPGLVGTQLVHAGALTVAGTYDCLVPLTGVTIKGELHLTATITSGSASSAVHTLYFVSDMLDPSSWVTKTAWSSAGALTTTVRQTVSLSTFAGEQFSLLRLTLASTPNVTFTQAEYNGI